MVLLMNHKLYYCAIIIVVVLLMKPNLYYFFSNNILIYFIVIIVITKRISEIFSNLKFKKRNEFVMKCSLILKRWNLPAGYNKRLILKRVKNQTNNL